METDKKMLPRRAVLSSLMGGGIVGAGMMGAAAPARATVPQYPQLVEPALTVLNHGGNYAGTYFVTGASAGPRVLAGGEEGLIVYSDDEGKSWRQAQVPVSGTITDIAFASPQVGWATGALGVVLKTQDGGKSWVKQLDGLGEIALMNVATQAYVAAQPPNSDAADRATRRDQILAGQGPDKPMLSLLPVSESEIFAFGSYRFAEYSTDGGDSWADWSFHIIDPTGYSHNIYGAAAIGGAYYLVSEESLIFRSTDGGQSFPMLAQPGGQGGATFFGICDTGDGGLLAYGVAGEMYLSNDQGKSWTQPQFTGTSNVNAVISLANGAVLLAGDAGGGLWYSRDHGKSFTLGVRNSIMSINALQPMGGLRFLLVSSIGVFPVDLLKMHRSA